MNNPMKTAAQRPDPTWWGEGALCAQADPELWFSDRPTLKAQAAAICAQCPVRQACVRAMPLTRFGIWGGRDRTKGRDLLGGAA